MTRHITSARRWQNSTFITLSCGHKRGLGGHMLDGRYVADPRDIVGREYDCQDGACYREGGQRA